MIWLGVHFPLLPLEVFTAGRTCPDPEVVIHDSRVVLRNPAAIEAGIAMGSTLATAHSIAAGVRHHRRNPERELERLTLLAEVLYGFSARVSLIPAAAGVVLEVGGSLKLFGGIERLAERALALCRDLGHEARVRWADTPLACLTLARADVERLGQVPLTRAALEPDRLTAERIERFANMGIHDLEQLLALPSRGVTARFGEDLVDYLARLTGERPDPRPAISPPERFRTTLHLLEPLRSKEALFFPMQRLLTDLQHWLVARQLGVEQLEWLFLGSGGRKDTDNRDLEIAPTRGAPTRGALTRGAPTKESAGPMIVRFARAQQQREAFLEITRLQMAEAVLPEEVIGLELDARRLVPWSAGSRGLFSGLPGMQSPADDLHGLDDLVDQLRARLGRGACYSLQVQGQHLPERAWIGVPPKLAVPRQPSRRGRKADPAVPTPTPKRPLWLFDPPRAIRPEQLTLLRGPERIHTGWWLAGGAKAQQDAAHPREVREPQEALPAVQTPVGETRDYYVARHRNGAQCWVFVDLREQWFLHGYFS
jgi:protein ImuB